LKKEAYEKKLDESKKKLDKEFSNWCKKVYGVAYIPFRIL